MSTRLHIVVSEELLARVDGALGPGQPRADFIRRAVQQALDSGGPTVRTRQVAVEDGPESEPATSPRPVSTMPVEAPAEQPSSEPPLSRADLFRRAGSAQAKRDVRPVPKKGEK